MASGTRSGKQPASVAPDDGSQDINTASADQQLAIRAFSPEQDAALDERFAQTNFVLAELMAQVRRLNERLDQQQILPSIETSPTAPSAPLPAPPAPQLPPQPISAPVPARSHPPSPSVETIEEVEHKQVYKPLRNIRKQPIEQKHRASKTVPRIRVSKSFEKCIGWPTKSGGINMRFSRDEEPDAWYTTMLNSTQKLASEAIPNRA